MKTCTSFKYIFEIVVPVLTSTFDHLSGLDYGPDLLVDEVCDTFVFLAMELRKSLLSTFQIQVAGYKILESLYILGTNLVSFLSLILSKYVIVAYEKFH